MNEAINLLFEKYFNGKPLFKNQLDLVTHLLNDPDTKYFIDSRDNELYNKALTRLKTYISQLLSQSASRNISEDFRTGLTVVIAKKIKNLKEAENVTDLILENLKQKNAAPLKQDSKNSVTEEFISDFYYAEYVAIITSRPLEIESTYSSSQFSLRKVFFDDFLTCLVDPNRDIKDYRFNFPLDSTAYLFWKGVKKILFRFLKGISHEKRIFDILYQKFAMKTQTYSDIQTKQAIPDEYLIQVTNDILEYLNRNKKFQVFIVKAPIYAMPLVALNPADTKTFKLFALLDEGTKPTSIYKYSAEDNFLWRLFVWDKLKSRDYAGVSMQYSKDI